MAQGPTYRVKFRRRREGKTNYYRRRRLLLSRRPRLVVRKTNSKIIVQIINARVVGDITEASAVSTELANYGWTGGACNTPAAYLTGILAARRAISRGVTNAVLDIGLNPPIKGSKIYGALKGAVDAGLDVPHDPEVLPDEDRISGKHIIGAFEYYASSGEKTQMFSKLGAKKTNITGLPKALSTVKAAIMDIPAAELKKKKKAFKPKAKAAAKPKPKKEAPEVKPPRPLPRKPKPKKLIARGKGKKGRKGSK
jgi:large subunit ribosomal protein L18